MSEHEQFSLINCYPYHSDIIQNLAKDIVACHKQDFPLLQNIVVIVPNYRNASLLRQHILRESGNCSNSALIGPQIFTFKDFFNKTVTLEKKALPLASRELILIEALQNHQNLFGRHNILTTAYALLELFDELTRNHTKLPENLDHFIAQLQHAYKSKNAQKQALSNEAQIVHTLWFAWHQQLKALDKLDEEGQYQLKISKSLKQKNNFSFHIAGFSDFLPSELQWIHHQFSQQKLRMYFQYEQDPSNDESNPINNLLDKLPAPIHCETSKDNTNLFFHSVFDNQDSHLLHRANQAKHHLKPIANKLSIYRANSFEEEAQAIVLQLRIWLSKNNEKFALILEDRRLARRIRALLQSNGIGLNDTAGWALSTTTSASVVESWLQCIEENFYYVPLLDILKSPFAFRQSEQHTQLIFRFEQDIVFHENIARDLSRYKKACISRQHRLDVRKNKLSDQLISLLNHINQSANIIQQVQQKETATLSEFLTALTESLTQLGAFAFLEQDDAGKKILTLLKELKHAITYCDIEMDWVTFRHWLGLKMEESNFIPENPFHYSVDLLTISNSALCKYDGIIICNMTKEQYPSTSKSSPFFNQNVRLELGLDTAKKQNCINYLHFRRLLESAPAILLTYHSGLQDSLPSPWLDLISNFHKLAFDNNLESVVLHALVNQQKDEKNDNNERSSTPIYPSVTEKHLPSSLSASAHQSLIHCPYAFFAGEVLKLRSSEEIKEKLVKSDYGERVHLCLHAFHAGGIANIDGPFTKLITEQTIQEATTLLIKISQQVFAYDLEDNFQHRGWLKRWLKVIPDYITWQLNREQQWKFKTGELKTAAKLTDHLELHGRIDRIDHSENALGIIDYKTGSIPHISDIENGEAIQLSHYALTNTQRVSQVEYVQFESNGKNVAEKCRLEEEDLDQLNNAVRKRLINIYESLKMGQQLPAWGDETICQYCHFTGLCRHQFN